MIQRLLAVALLILLSAFVCFSQGKGFELSVGLTASKLYNLPSDGYHFGSEAIYDFKREPGVVLGIGYLFPIVKPLSFSTGLRYNYKSQHFTRNTTGFQWEGMIPNTTCDSGYNHISEGPVTMNFHSIHIPLNFDLRYKAFHFACGISIGTLINPNTVWRYNVSGTTYNSDYCTVPATGSGKVRLPLTSYFSTEAEIAMGYGVKVKSKRLWMDVGYARTLTAFELRWQRFGINTFLAKATFEL
jgi:hypothetical protein